MSTIEEPTNEHIQQPAQKDSFEFIRAHFTIMGIRIPYVVLLILLIAVGWYLYSNKNKKFNLTSDPMVGGALNASSEVNSSFLNNMHL